MASLEEIEADIPNLVGTTYIETSDATDTYNCIAFAVGELHGYVDATTVPMSPATKRLRYTAATGMLSTQPDSYGLAVGLASWAKSRISSTIAPSM